MKPVTAIQSEFAVVAASALDLTSDDFPDIDSATSRIKVEGARYPERLEKMTRL